MSIMKRATRIIEIATRGARTIDGHPLKISADTARNIAEALDDEGLIMPGHFDEPTMIWGRREKDGRIIWIGADALAERLARESGRGVARYIGPIATVGER